jgi:hypothetical protein
MIIKVFSNLNLKPNNMRNLKTTMIAALLMLAAVGEVVAQERWEFATVRSTFGYSSIVFTTAENQEVIPTKPKENEKELIKKVNDLSLQGWEVFNTTDASGGSADIIKSYYLRKKKN